METEKYIVARPPGSLVFVPVDEELLDLLGRMAAGAFAPEGADYSGVSLRARLNWHGRESPLEAVGPGDSDPLPAARACVRLESLPGVYNGYYSPVAVVPAGETAKVLEGIREAGFSLEAVCANAEICPGREGMEADLFVVSPFSGRSEFSLTPVLGSLGGRGVSRV
jgi:hypothetical protein